MCQDHDVSLAPLITYKAKSYSCIVTIGATSQPSMSITERRFVMATNGQSIINLIRAGKVSQPELKQMFADASSGNVSVQDWGACYSSGTGQLSEYCTVIANDPNNPITGVGMLAYSSDGTTLFCLQYTNDFSSPSVATSVGTTQFSPQDGNEVLGVVYGWTENSSFYLTKTLTIVPCQ
jgi:hypothetical protein